MTARPIIHDGLISVIVTNFDGLNSVNGRHFFVRPKAHSNISTFQIISDAANPMVRVFARFTEPKGYIVTFRNVGLVIDARKRHGRPIAVNGKTEVVVPRIVRGVINQFPKARSVIIAFRKKSNVWCPLA